MRLYPAIDLKEGKCVRLRQGNFSDVTIYGEDPAAIARRFAEAGASYLHTVDLDGALAGHSVNLEVLRQIVQAVPIPVQNGGGIRCMQDIEDKLSVGLARVIIGTAAVRNPDFLQQALKEYGPERIAVGIDARDGWVAVSGWEQVSRVRAVELGQRMAAMGLRYAVYTDISRDGMLTGPNLEATVQLMRETGLSVILSGGVSSLQDLQRAAEAGIPGAIIGKALYEGRVDLARAVTEIERGNT